MRIHRLAGVVALLALLGGCFEERLEVTTITLDYLTNAQAAELVTPYLSSGGTVMASQTSLNTITVKDRRDNVRRVRSLLNERDVSPQNVSLHFQVIRATEAGAMDPDLAKVGAALRELLRFEGYELVAQTVVSASERRVVEQSLSGGEFPLHLGVRINDITSGSGSVDMEVNLRRDRQASLLATNVVVPMGQTVVLGSAYPGVSGEALILTVRGERGSTKLRTSSRRTREDQAVVDVYVGPGSDAQAAVREALEHQSALERAHAAEAAAAEVEALVKGTAVQAKRVESRIDGPGASTTVRPAPSPTRRGGVPPEGAH